MPVQIGQKESHFGSPLGLLSDCHRRIETFLGVLNRLARDGDGRELSEEERTALSNALAYFRTSAPNHTADEEISLFPRLRALDHPMAKDSLDKLTALESDHVLAAADHSLVDLLGLRLLEKRALSSEDRRSLREALGRLSRLYARHIVVEDTELFPLAGRVLPVEELASIGREMAERRGVKHR
jgi:hemerythrin-like domain-containing protein